MKVSDIMTFGVATAKADTSLLVVLRLMREHRIGALPIVDSHGCLLGLVNETDFFGDKSGECLIATLLECDLPARVTHLQTQKAASIMQLKPVTTNGNTSLPDAARTLAHQHAARLPVIEGSQLVGMLSRTDLLDYLVNTTK